MSLKCKSCPTHPELEDSGRSEPEDARCPVCGVLYDKQSGLPSEEYIDIVAAHAAEQAKKKEEEKPNRYELPPDSILTEEEVDELLEELNQGYMPT